MRPHQALWADTIAICLASVENSDAYGLDRFLGLFGGAGSLNDLVLHSRGAPLREENNRLHDLLQQAHDLGWRLARERQQR